MAEGVAVAVAVVAGCIGLGVAVAVAVVAGCIGLGATIHIQQEIEWSSVCGILF